MANDGTAHNKALENLQAMLNLTLVEIGRVFDNPKQRDPSNASMAKLKLRKAVGGAKDEFHEALDELETELSKARDVMRRDLAVMIGAKEATSSSAQTSNAAQAPSSTNGDTLMTDVKDEPDLASAPVAEVTPRAPVAPVAPMVAAAKAEPSKEFKTEAVKTEQNAPLPLTTPSALGTTTQPSEMPKTEEPSVPPALAEPLDLGAADDTAGDVPLENDDALELDFDSMFADLPAPVDGEGSLNGDLDFHLGGTEELLPGLESYANLGADLHTPLGGAENIVGVITDPLPVVTTSAPASNDITSADFDFINQPAGGEDGGQQGDGGLDLGTLDTSDVFADLMSFTDMDGTEGGDGGDANNFNELFGGLGDLEGGDGG